MKDAKQSLGKVRQKHAQQTKHGALHKRFTQGEIMRLILTIWLLVASVAIILLYLFTRDATIVLLWTSCLGLITIVFTYFFQK